MITTEITDQGYHLVDSTTGERRTYPTQREFSRAILPILIEETEKIDAAFHRVIEAEERPQARRRTVLPPECRDTVHSG